MNGAESLVHTLAECGVEICFGNPGTSEMHFVAALDREPRMRGVLCLSEGVVAGAADGYARMTGKPAAVVSWLCEIQLPSIPSGRTPSTYCWATALVKSMLLPFRRLRV